MEGLRFVVARVLCVSGFEIRSEKCDGHGFEQNSHVYAHEPYAPTHPRTHETTRARARIYSMRQTYFSARTKDFEVDLLANASKFSRNGFRSHAVAQ